MTVLTSEESLGIPSYPSMSVDVVPTIEYLPKVVARIHWAPFTTPVPQAPQPQESPRRQQTGSSALKGKSTAQTNAANSSTAPPLPKRVDVPPRYLPIPHALAKSIQLWVDPSTAAAADSDHKSSATISTSKRKQPIGGGVRKPSPSSSPTTTSTESTNVLVPAVGCPIEICAVRLDSSSTPVGMLRSVSTSIEASMPNINTAGCGDEYFGEFESGMYFGFSRTGRWGMLCPSKNPNPSILTILQAVIARGQQGGGTHQTTATAASFMGSGPVGGLRSLSNSSAAFPFSPTVSQSSKAQAPMGFAAAGMSDSLTMGKSTSGDYVPPLDMTLPNAPSVLVPRAVCLDLESLETNPSSVERNPSDGPPALTLPREYAFARRDTAVPCHNRFSSTGSQALEQVQQANNNMKSTGDNASPLSNDSMAFHSSSSPQAPHPNNEEVNRTDVDDSGDANPPQLTSGPTAAEELAASPPDIGTAESVSGYEHHHFLSNVAAHRLHSLVFPALHLTLEEQTGCSVESSTFGFGSTFLSQVTPYAKTMKFAAVPSTLSGSSGGPARPLSAVPATSSSSAAGGRVHLQCRGATDLGRLRGFIHQLPPLPSNICTPNKLLDLFLRDLVPRASEYLESFFLQPETVLAQNYATFIADQFSKNGPEYELALRSAQQAAALQQHLYSKPFVPPTPLAAVASSDMLNFLPPSLQPVGGGGAGAHADTPVLRSSSSMSAAALTSPSSASHQQSGGGGGGGGFISLPLPPAIDPAATAMAATQFSLLLGDSKGVYLITPGRSAVEFLLDMEPLPGTSVPASLSVPCESPSIVSLPPGIPFEFLTDGRVCKSVAPSSTAWVHHITKFLSVPRGTVARNVTHMSVFTHPNPHTLQAALQVCAPESSNTFVSKMSAAVLPTNLSRFNERLAILPPPLLSSFAHVETSRMLVFEQALRTPSLLEDLNVQLPSALARLSSLLASESSSNEQPVGGAKPASGHSPRGSIRYSRVGSIGGPPGTAAAAKRISFSGAVSAVVEQRRRASTVFTGGPTTNFVFPSEDVGGGGAAGGKDNTTTFDRSTTDDAVRELVNSAESLATSSASRSIGGRRTVAESLPWLMTSLPDEKHLSSLPSGNMMGGGDPLKSCATFLQGLICPLVEVSIKKPAASGPPPFNNSRAQQGENSSSGVGPNNSAATTSAGSAPLSNPIEIASAPSKVAHVESVAVPKPTTVLQHINLRAHPNWGVIQPNPYVVAYNAAAQPMKRGAGQKKSAVQPPPKK